MCVHPSPLRPILFFLFSPLQTNQIKGSLVVTGVRIARAGKLEKRQNTQWKKEKERKKERRTERNPNLEAIWQRPMTTTWMPALSLPLLNYVPRIGSIDCHHRTQKSFLLFFLLLLPLSPFFLIPFLCRLLYPSDFEISCPFPFFFLTPILGKIRKTVLVFFSFLSFLVEGEVDGLSISHLVFFYDSHSIHFISTMFVYRGVHV
jgi:hypothetical protein